MPKKLGKGYHIERMRDTVGLRKDMELQCPKCQCLLERSSQIDHGPGGHVELRIPEQGYLVLAEIGNRMTPLHYGEKFREGTLWKKVMGRCELVIYIAAEAEREEDWEPLHRYLVAQGKRLSVTSFKELEAFKFGKNVPLILSHKMRRLEQWKISIHHRKHPIYIFVSGAVIRTNWLKMFREKLKNSLYKVLVTPIVSKCIETRYEQYLSDKATASQFAKTYLPETLQEGWGRNAFDVGCGRGRHAAMLSQLGFQVTGMDLQPHPYWSRIPNASFLVGTVGSLSSIPNGTFDLVVCMQVLMYLLDDNTALAQMRRILKREGYLFLQVTNADNLHTAFTQQPLIEDPYLERYYHKPDLCNKLEQNGFMVERVWMEKFYFPFFVSLGNICYEFVLNDKLRAILDRWISPRHLGLMNILARPKQETISAQR